MHVNLIGKSFGIQLVCYFFYCSGNVPKTEAGFGSPPSGWQRATPKHMSLHNLAHLSTSHFRSTYRVSKLVPIGAHMDPLKYPMLHMQRCWQVTRILSSSSRLREVGSSAAGRLTWSIPSSNVLLEEVLVSVISPGCAGKLEAKNPAKKQLPYFPWMPIVKWLGWPMFFQCSLKNARC